jgi:hypothetical protein
MLRLAFAKLVSAMMTTTTDNLDQDHMDDQDASDDDDDYSSSSTTLEIFPVSSCSDNGQQLSTMSHSFSPNNAFEFYSKPFHISKNNNSSSIVVGGGGGNNNTSKNQIPVLAAAVIMYNLGLANQILAITKGKSALLEKSVLHYHRALQLLDQCSDTAAINVATNVLHLAICNNCGYCHSYMFDDVSTRNFQEYMKLILKNLSSCSSSKHEHVEYSYWETECDYFYSSALVYGSETLPVMLLAPAA